MRGRTMKKYVKPELFYEKYELSQHIADCQWELQYGKNQCVATPDPEDMPGYDKTLFSAELSCDITNYEDYCYQNGTGAIKVFIS